MVEDREDGDDALEHIGEPSHRLDAVEFGGLDEGHGDRPVTGPAVGAGEECRSSCHRYRPDGALHDIVVCALEGALLSPVEIRAGKLSLQPEALGAGQEATNGLKHFEKRPL